MFTPTHSLIIPVYNEAARLPRTLPRLLQGVAELPYPVELLFVDDGSTDATVALLTAAPEHTRYQILRLARNAGKGWAVRTGMLAATGQYRAFLDADLATPVAEVATLFAALAAGDPIAIGSRVGDQGRDARTAGEERQPVARRVLGRLFYLFATRPLLGSIRDSQCGAKAFTAEATRALFTRQRTRRWSFDLEILYLAKRAGIAVHEIPVAWTAQDDSKLRASLGLALTTIKELVQIVWWHRKTTFPTITE